MPDLSQLLSQIQSAMQADRFRLRKAVRNLEQQMRAGKEVGSQLEKLTRDVTQSAERRARRADRLPVLNWDAELPISARRDEIAAAIQQHQVVVVCGETGSGKSTQLPKICLSIGRGVTGLIGHTQPRRIAARTIAARLAQELGPGGNQMVGFKIRFTDSTSPETYVKLMTDGILLAETQGDRFLDQYDTIIVDEAHERSLNIDFLLGYLKRLLPKRPDLRVIITSATIDSERFAMHFGTASLDRVPNDPSQPTAERLSESTVPAPVVEVSGRMYPVEVRYRPPEPAEDDDEPDWQQGVVDAVDELLRLDRHGDLLVFLATEREILDVTKALRGRATAAKWDLEILPLYARLSAKEQNRVFEPHSRRRIVLATNVAESSLTVPGIRYVVDAGTARISRYAPRRKIQRLPIEAISRASADQRAGRCGRLGPGVCIRLYSEEDYTARDRYTTPEIRRANLAAVILQAESLRLGSLDEFPFLDPPSTALIRDGYATLFELGAVDDENRLTPLGQALSRLPVDPRIGRMILAGQEEHCLRDVLIVASALEVQDPRDRPVDKQQQADAAHAQWASPESDFVSLLNLWNFFHQLKEKLSRSQLQKACHQNFLSFTRMREWLDVHRQLEAVVSEQRAVASKQPSSKGNTKTTDHQPLATDHSPQIHSPLHRSLLTGLLANVAQKTDVHEYTGAGGTKLQLWPGSSLFAQKPQWLVAAELVETTRRYARTVARIDPDWIEPLASHLVKQSYSDPHWSSKSGTVMAYEKVTLFGLTVVARRPVPLGPIDPATARGLFIQHALVEGDLRQPAEFFTHNRRLRQEIEALAAKTRRADYIVNDFKVRAFYESRVPADVYDAPRLHKWRKQAERDSPRLLFMTPADLSDLDERPAANQFPERCAIDRMQLPLEYRFEPGAEHDGVTLVVPKDGINQVSPERLGWLVPGLLEQKIVELIRALPKELRTNFVPVPETAKKVVGLLKFGEGRFLDEVAAILTRLASEPIRVDALVAAQNKLPPHLHMNVRVVDERGKTLSAGRDLTALREELGVPAAASGTKLQDATWTRDGLTKWEFGPLPESVDVSRGGVKIAGYPALIDQGQTVSLRLLDSRHHAAEQTRGGVRRLFVISERRSLLAHVDWFPDFQQLVLCAAGLLTGSELREQLCSLLADRAFLAEHPLPRSADEFAVRLKLGRQQCDLAVQDVVRVITPLFRNYQAVRLALESAPAHFDHAKTDLRTQLASLFPANFLTATPSAWLQHVPRFLEAARYRLERLSHGNLARDRQLQTSLQPLWQSLSTRQTDHARRGISDPELVTYRWWLEEYRVSLFAQHLGTSTPISVKRLEKQWEKVLV